MTNIKNYTELQIEQIIKEHIIKMFMYDIPDAVLSNDLPLFEEEIVESLGIFRLGSFLEEKFGITINSEEYLLDNFETVNAIKSFAIHKLSITSQE